MMSRWQDIETLLCNPSSFPNESGALANGYFKPGPEVLSFPFLLGLFDSSFFFLCIFKLLDMIHEAPILILGAGGLGCELLKDLALTGFQEIHVIDMDTIDVSNLNRQFLFRKKDVGHPKAEIASAFINARVPGARVTPHFCKLQDKDDDFFHQVLCMFLF